MSSPIKTLFDHHAKHWMNTSMEHLENIIKAESQEELLNFVVKTLQTYVFDKLNVYARRDDLGLVIKHYFSQTENNKAYSQTNFDQLTEWYVILFNISYNKYGGKDQLNVTKNNSQKSISQYEYELLQCYGKDQFIDEDETHPLSRLEYNTLPELLNIVYKMVKKMLFVNRKIIKQFDYCNNIIYKDLENEHIRKLVLKLFYSDDIVAKIIDGDTKATNGEDLKQLLLQELNKPNAAVVEDLIENFEEEKAKLEASEEKEGKEGKEKKDEERKNSDDDEDSSSSSSSSSSSDEEDGFYNDDTFEEEKFTSSELTELFLKFKLHLDNLPSNQEKKKFKKVSKAQINEMKKELFTLTNYRKQDKEKNKKMKEDVRVEDKILVLEENIKKTVQEFREYRDHVLEGKMLQIVATRERELYTAGIKNDMYERLELSEEVDAEIIEETAIQATLALSQTKEGRTGKETPIIAVLQTYASVYEGAKGGNSNDWLSLMKHMINQFCNFKVLLQENCYKVALLDVESDSDENKEKNIFNKLLQLRNNGGTSGQLGMKDIQTDEFPIQKIIKVYNSILPKDVNKVERKRLYGLINHMLYVSPERILLCEHVYSFLNQKCIYNFLTRCGGVRNVLLQMDSNGNTPIFFAIENLKFQGENDQTAIKNRKLFKYMIKGGVVQNEHNDKDNRNNNNNNNESKDDAVNFGDTVLRSHDASFKNSRDTALHRAVYYEKVYAVEEILKQDPGIRRIKNSDGLTPLQINIQLGKNSSGTSAQSRKIRRILSGQLEFEKLLEKKQIRNKKTYVKVPVNGTKSGFFISELLEMDTQERDVILIIKGRNIPWKKENDISVLPENLHKFETAKYRTINSVKQIEFENKVNAPPKDFDENEISDAEFLRQTGLEICIGSLNAFKRKLKINLMSMLKKKDLVIKWINFLIKDEKYLNLIGIRETEKNRLKEWKKSILHHSRLNITVEDNKDIIKSKNVIKDRIDIIVSDDKNKKMTPMPPHDKSNNNIVNNKSPLVKKRSLISDNIQQKKPIDTRDLFVPGKELSTTLLQTQPKLANWFSTKYCILFTNDLTTLSNIISPTTYKRNMNADQIEFMRSISNIRERFNFCDSHSNGFATGPLGLFTNVLLMKLNYFFEDELKHKEIWKNENSEIHILVPNTGKWHSLSGELQDCQCIKRLFHASIRKIEQYVHYLNEEKNNDTPLHDIKSITEFIGKFKILQPHFHSWKMRAKINIQQRGGKKKKLKIKVGNGKSTSTMQAMYSPVRRNVIQKVEQRLYKIFSTAKQDTIIINGKDGKQMKQNGLTSEDIATHFYKGSINGQIGLKDFQIALQQLGIFIQANEIHELMKIISGPSVDVVKRNNAEIQVNIDTFLQFINKANTKESSLPVLSTKQVEGLWRGEGNNNDAKMDQVRVSSTVIQG